MEITSIITNEKIIPAVIAAFTTIVVFFLTLLTKNFIDTRILSSKLETEHKFDQRKKIKEVLAKHKVHLLSAAEILNHRMWNFSKNHSKGWIDVQGDFLTEKYYLHSFAYRILCLFTWINQVQKDMIYLDTTIAQKEDLEFIKFLKIFPQIFCDLTFIEGQNADGNYAVDHFFRNNFDELSRCLQGTNGLKSYDVFIEDLSPSDKNLIQLLKFLDGICPLENRKRWDRLHCLNITLIIFLNNYGYDFQKTKTDKIKKILTIPKTSSLLKNYFDLFKEYNLDTNKEVKKVKKIAQKYF
ncbi:hypothetical protein B4N84_17940 [Flavobacterium sp. IR1]|nr:hypothetical protein B4N84_17940 [Flavobacterium sp. IR1]